MPPNLLGHVQRSRTALARGALTVLLLLALTPARTWADEPAAEPTTPPGAGLTPPPAVDPPATPPASLPPTQPEPPQPPAEVPSAVMENNVHSVGVTLSFSTGAGFAYRRQWGATSLQLAAFGVVTDRGNSTLVSGGAQVAQRLHVWHGPTRGLLPATSALRVLAGLSYFLNRSVTNDSVPLGGVLNNTVCTAQNGCVATVTTNSSYFNGGAGLGFEFGAIDRPGVSMTLDVVLTAALKDGSFSFLLPLPQLAVLYNW